MNEKKTTKEKVDVSQKEEGAIVNDTTEETVEDYILSNFLESGFESLTEEELATSLISTNYGKNFKKKTGQDWESKYKQKILEILDKAKFDTHWIVNTNPNNAKFLPLFEFCKIGDNAKITEFIKVIGIGSLNAVDSSMKSPLHVVSANGHTQIVESLWKMGANLESRDKFLRTPFHLASLGGHESVIKLMLRLKVNHKCKDSSKRTVLHYACCSNNLQVITFLTSKFAELVNFVDYLGRTALHYAVWNDNSEIAKILIEKKADVNAADKYKRTPLHYASEGGKMKILATLLQNGAKISISEEKKNMTVYQLAANEEVKKAIVYYTSPPFKTCLEDVDYMKSVKNIPVQPLTQTTDIQIQHENIPQNTKEFLISLLRRVQEYGVSSYQHIKKPYLFTGSWMEQVKTLEDLMKTFASITSSDAVMRYTL